MLLEGFMESGKLYVVFNEWICDPETKEKPYKIGITRNTVEDRYYGLGLKMPGKFETLFAYEIRDCTKAERAIQDIFNKYCVNGEWFRLKQKDLDMIEEICVKMGGELITSEVEDEIESATEEKNIPSDKESGDNYDETQEIKKIERKISGWFLGTHQYNSRILYAFIKLYEQNNGVVTYGQLKKEANMTTFKGNFDQMKNFGIKNHGKIFEQDGENIYLWKKIENIIWENYKKYGKKDA
jgi:hypothetical protein